MEPTEEQFLVFNALEIVLYSLYDPDDGSWYISTLSPILPVAKILPDGEITPVNF
jgi:hypothetical protein